MAEQIKRFIDQIKEGVNKEWMHLSSGWVYFDRESYHITEQQKGAEEDLFSVGQPVYDKDGNLMGYLGIDILTHLNYASDCDVKTPCEVWKICRPTEYCKHGKRVYTYWQNKEKESNDGRAEE